MDHNGNPLRPVQVILDKDRFLVAPERPPGGSNRDFFAGDDAGFARHKQQMREELDGFAQTIETQGDAVGFVHVQLREAALAKSHRPLDRVFSRYRKFSLVGGDANGELLVQATPRALKELSEAVEREAEATPPLKYNKKTERDEPKASEFRSELGAVDELRLHTREDRLRFETEDALRLFRQPNVIGSYIIDLFRIDPGVLGSGAARRAVSNLLTALSAVPGGLLVRPALPESLRERLLHPTLALSVRPLKDSRQRHIALPKELRDIADNLPALPPPGPGIAVREADLDLDPGRHRDLLTALAEQSLVRSIDLPLVIDEGTAPSIPHDAAAALPLPVADFDHPILAVIDGGVASIPALDPWIVGRLGAIAPDERDTRHGTFIAGLAAGAYHFNPHLADYVEPFGVKIFDLDIFPRRDLRGSYYVDHADFLNQLDANIARAKAEHGIRVFNFSFACGSPQPGSYSVYAEGLDAIARKHDIIFVVSAGNLQGAETRPPWPADPKAAVQMLAAQPQLQAITPPAEAFHALTVGALNPPGFTDHPTLLPTSYTRRGPGTGYARKPDLAHIGGVSPDASTQNRTGLVSLHTDGLLCDSMGTSFAAPLVAAGLATLDQRLMRHASRELLQALMIHNAQREPSLTGKELAHIAPDFVGYGMPSRADSMLVDDPSAITIVFDQPLPAGRILSFDFSWP